MYNVDSASNGSKLKRESYERKKTGFNKNQTILTIAASAAISVAAAERVLCMYRACTVCIRIM